MSILAVVFSFGLIGLIIYLTLRYGPVSYEWVRIDKDEIKKLKAEFKRYRQMNPPGKPEGRPVYKKGLVSHEGLAIYQNGIYAKFCVGRSGRYRFVRFSEISDIYPVIMENPFTKKDSIWMGLKSWKQLQVEAQGGMLCMINSRKHDLQKVVPILRNAMGGRWDSVYHQEETLWSNIKEGDAYIHKLIRRERPGYVPRKIKKEKERKVVPLKGKGALLVQESEADLEKRRRSFRIGGAIIAVIGVVILSLGILLVNIGFFFVTILSIVLTMLGATFLILGLFISATSNKMGPIKVYENGFEIPLFLPGKTRFISYGEITGCTTKKSLLEGDMYVYSTTLPNQMITIRKDMMGFEGVRSHIRSRIARPEYIVELEPTPEEIVTSRRIEYTLYATGVIVGVIGSIIMTATVFGGMPSSFFIYGLGFVLPPFTMFSVTLVTYSMKNLKKIVPKRLNVKIPVIIVVLLLIYSVATLSLGFMVGGETGLSPNKIEPKPTTSSLESGLYENMDLYVGSDILVDSNQTLQIRNSSLTLNLSYDKEAGIWIAKGGSLILENTTIKSDPLDFGYTFEIMGSARIINSSIMGVWGDPENENDDGGLEIYSSNVLIDGTTISYARANGILIKNSGPIISNSTIIHIDDDGLELRNSWAQILNNTIRDCGWAMIIAYGSRAEIAGNNITHNQHGIWVGNSDPTIMNNIFFHNRNYAIEFNEYSNPTIRNNIYLSNDDDVIAEEPSRILQLCLILTVGEAVFCLLILFWVYKQGLEEETSRIQPIS